MKKYLCQLQSLRVHVMTEKNGDEVLLRLKGKKIWPIDDKFTKVSNDSPVKIGVLIEQEKLGESLQIELWEFDNLLWSKRIGLFSLKLDSVGGPYVTDLSLTSKEFARYSLVWGVSEITNKVPLK